MHPADLKALHRIRKELRAMGSKQVYQLTLICPDGYELKDPETVMQSVVEELRNVGIHAQMELFTVEIDEPPPLETLPS